MPEDININIGSFNDGCGGVEQEDVLCVNKVINACWKCWIKCCCDNCVFGLIWI